MSKIIIAAFFVMLLAGCASSGRGSYKSYTAESFPVASGGLVVDDLAERIQSAYPPGQTVVYLTGKDEFGMALENKLRGYGFTVVPEPESEALTVGWTVNQLEPGFWYLLVRLSDGYRFSRVYTDNGQTIIPDGGLSQSKF